VTGVKVQLTNTEIFIGVVGFIVSKPRQSENSNTDNIQKEYGENDEHKSSDRGGQ
jgi:hypothetical protein